MHAFVHVDSDCTGRGVLQLPPFVVCSEGSSGGRHAIRSTTSRWRQCSNHPPDFCVPKLAATFLFIVVVSLVRDVASLESTGACATSSTWAQPRLLDIYGDPLPPFAAARLGTVRLRNESKIESLAFSADSLYLVSAGRSLSILRVNDGVRVCHLPATDDRFIAATFVVQSPPCVACVSALTNKVSLRDASTFAELRSWRLPHKWERAACFSPTGRFLATPVSEERIAVFDTLSGRIICEWSSRGCVPDKLIFSATEDLLIVAGKDIRIVNAGSAQEIRRLPNPFGIVTALSLSADGNSIALACDYGKVVLLDSKSGRVRYQHEPYYSSVTCLCFTASNQLCWSNTGGEVYCRKLAPDGRNQPTKPVLRISNSVNSMCLSPDSSKMALTDPAGVIHIINVETWRPSCPLVAHNAKVASIVFAAHGDIVISGGADGELILWKRATSRSLGCRRFGNPISSISFSATNQTIAVVCLGSRNISFRDPLDGKELYHLSVPDGQMPTCVSFAPDGKTFAIGTLEGTIYIFDPASNKLTALGMGGGSRRRGVSDLSGVSAVTFISEGRALLSVAEGIAQLWDLSRRKLIGRYGLRTVHSAVALDHAALLLTGEEDSAIRYWDPEHGRCTREVLLLEGRMGGTCLALSPDEKTVAVGLANGEVRLIETLTGQLRGVMLGHRSAVTCIAFGPTGSTCASGSRDTSLVLWDLDTVFFGRHEPRVLGDAQVENSWTDLAGLEQCRVRRAFQILASSPNQTLRVMEAHLHPVPIVDASTVIKLLEDLDDRDFVKRERAHAELERLREIPLANYKRVQRESASAELRRRVDDLLSKLDPISSPRIRQELRAIEILEHIGGSRATMLLLKLSSGSPLARLTEEARRAVNRVNNRHTGKP